MQLVIAWPEVFTLAKLSMLLCQPTQRTVSLNTAPAAPTAPAAADNVITIAFIR